MTFRSRGIDPVSATFDQSQRVAQLEARVAELETAARAVVQWAEGLRLFSEAGSTLVPPLAALRDVCAQPGTSEANIQNVTDREQGSAEHKAHDFHDRKEGT